MKTFVIAEIGVNHNGSLDQALRLVEVAANAGANAAKFQSFKADKLVTLNAGTVAYQKNFADGASQHSMLRALEFSKDHHHKVAAWCRDLGIEFMSTAFDSPSLDLLCEIGIRRIKIPSGEVTNIPFLRDCARRGLPIILSTGMANLEETQKAVDVLRASGAADITILHCTSAYPTELADVNLLAMQTLGREIKLPVGYSDHTQGIFVPPLAVAMGACVIEKHITLDRNLPGPDHAASIEPDELEEMVRRIRDAETALGDGDKQPRQAEEEARAMVRRGLKAARSVTAGTILAEEDIVILRPTTGLAPEYFDQVIGARLMRDLAAGDPINAEDVGWNERV